MRMRAAAAAELLRSDCCGAAAAERLLRTLRRLASGPTASVILSCQATHASIWPALRPTLFIAATYVTVLNTQVRTCSMANLL